MKRLSTFMHICRAFLTLCVPVPDYTQYGSMVDHMAYHIHTMHYNLFPVPGTLVLAHMYMSSVPNCHPPGAAAQE